MARKEISAVIAAIKNRKFSEELLPKKITGAELVEIQKSCKSGKILKSIVKHYAENPQNVSGFSNDDFAVFLMYIARNDQGALNISVEDLLKIKNQQAVKTGSGFFWQKKAADPQQLHEITLNDEVSKKLQKSLAIIFSHNSVLLFEKNDIFRILKEGGFDLLDKENLEKILLEIAAQYPSSIDEQKLPLTFLAQSSLPAQDWSAQERLNLLKSVNESLKEAAQKEPDAKKALRHRTEVLRQHFLQYGRTIFQKDNNISLDDFFELVQVLDINWIPITPALQAYIAHQLSALSVEQKLNYTKRLFELAEVGLNDSSTKTESEAALEAAKTISSLCGIDEGEMFSFLTPRVLLAGLKEPGQAKFAGDEIKRITANPAAVKEFIQRLKVRGRNYRIAVPDFEYAIKVWEEFDFDLNDEEILNFFRESFKDYSGLVPARIIAKPYGDMTALQNGAAYKLNCGDYEVTVKSVHDFVLLYKLLPHLFYENPLQLNEMLSNPELYQAYMQAFNCDEQGVKKLINELESFIQTSRKNQDKHLGVCLETFDQLLASMLERGARINDETLFNLLSVLNAVDILSPQGRDLINTILAHQPEFKSVINNALAGKMRSEVFSPRGVKTYKNLSQYEFDRLFIKEFFADDAEAQKEFIDGLDNITLIYLYPKFDEATQKKIKVKIAEFVKDHGLGAVLVGIAERAKNATSTSRNFEVSSMLQVIQKMSFEVSVNDPNLQEVNGYFASLPHIHTLFIAIVLKANNEQSNSSATKLPQGIYYHQSLKLEYVRDLLMLARLVPADIDHNMIQTIATSPQTIAAINDNLKSPQALYVTATSYNLFSRINQLVPKGAVKIDLDQLLPVNELFEIKRKFTPSKKVLNPQVINSALYRAIAGKAEFDEFYDMLSDEEREELGIFIIRKNDIAEAKTFLAELVPQLEEIIKNLPPLQNLPPSIVRAITVLAQRIKILIRNDEILVGSAREALKEGASDEKVIQALLDFEMLQSDLPTIAKVFNSLSQDIREILNFDPKVLFKVSSKCHLLDNLSKINYSQEVKRNWRKLLLNSDSLKERAELAHNYAEFRDVISASFSLIVQQNCEFNLSHNIEKTKTEKSFKKAENIAYVNGLNDMVMPYLNSQGDVILQTSTSEEILAKKATSIYIPLEAFMHRVGANFNKKTEAPKDNAETAAMPEVENEAGEYLEVSASCDLETDEQNKINESAMERETQNLAQEELERNRESGCRILKSLKTHFKGLNLHSTKVKPLETLQQKQQQSEIEC